MLHHGSIRKYTAAILEFFNSVEIQYEKTTGDVVTKEVPLKYSSREKARVFDEYTVEQFLSGNYNVLPKGSLTLSSMSKTTDRVTNKNAKLNLYKTDSTFEYMYNSVPYLFEFEIIFQCRGMNEATQIIEQIAPKFNPAVNLDIWDAQNLNEPTRVPVMLNDISMEHEDYEELSSNLVTVVFNIGLQGNLYPPIRAIPRIQEFQMYINQVEQGNQATRQEMLEWDVDLEGKIKSESLDIYTDELSNEIVYNTNEEKTTLDSDRIDVSGLGDHFNSTTIEGILSEIATSINQGETGTIRLDRYIESQDATNIVYSDGSRKYLLNDDVDRPRNKIAYTEYGDGPNDPITAIAYNENKRIARVDYYRDRSTFNVDGSGRNGYTIYEYNSIGKLARSTFVNLED